MEVSTLAMLRNALSYAPNKLNPDVPTVPAGVMVLMYTTSDEYHVILNKRSTSVGDHKGEVSFPGGTMEIEDETLMQTALRETYEEIGVLPEDVEVLGELDDVLTSTNYLVRPFVGAISHGYKFVPNPREVQEIIDVPAKYLFHIDSFRHEVMIVNGISHSMPCYVYQNNVIWGATAKILQNLNRIVPNF